MEYISLQYRWENKRSIDFMIVLDQGRIVSIYDESNDLSLVAQQLSGFNVVSENSAELGFLRKELVLVQPLLLLDYLEQQYCPDWLAPFHQHLKFQKNRHCTTDYPEVDQLYQQYKSRAQYPIVKRLLKLFSNEVTEKLSIVGFLDKLGPASEIFINHKMEEPNDNIKTKVRAAHQRFAQRYA